MNLEVKPLNPAITDSTNLKRLFALILMALVSSVAGCGEPPVEFVHTANARQIIDNEKWIVINYWALWCAPCRTEIPELNELAAEHGDRLVVYGVNFDQPGPDKMAAAVEQMGIAFPVFQNDPYQMLGYEQPQVLPTTIMMAPGNGAYKVLIGPQTVESLLDEIQEK